jgi:hypothetical protein
VAANLIFLDDTLAPISTENLGSILGGAFAQVKLYISNTGTTSASSAVLKQVRQASNDGVSYVQCAPDSGGNPGTYTSNDISFGTIAAGQSIPFWLKASLPNGVSPAGNPRLLELKMNYTGT